mgnify:CR=1 FL=1
MIRSRVWTAVLMIIIAKPFGMLEMVARIKAVLRRCAAPRRDEDDEETIRIGRLEGQTDGA